MNAEICEAHLVIVVVLQVPLDVLKHSALVEPDILCCCLTACYLCTSVFGGHPAQYCGSVHVASNEGLYIIFICGLLDILSIGG